MLPQGSRLSECDRPVQNAVANVRRQAGLGDDVHLHPKALLQVVGQRDQVEQAAALRHIDEEVEIAGGTLLVAFDRAEHAHIARPVGRGDAEHVLPDLRRIAAGTTTGSFFHPVPRLGSRDELIDQLVGDRPAADRLAEALLRHMQTTSIVEAMGYERIKTEHAGAKNGGGTWMTRAEAKQTARRRRRQIDRQAAADVLLDDRGDLDQFSAHASRGVLRHMTEDEEAAGLSWEGFQPE